MAPAPLMARWDVDGRRLLLLFGDQCRRLKELESLCDGSGDDVHNGRNDYCLAQASDLPSLPSIRTDPGHRLVCGLAGVSPFVRPGSLCTLPPKLWLWRIPFLQG